MADVGSASINITADDSQARKTVGGFFGFLKKSTSIAASLTGGLAIFNTVKDIFDKVGASTIGANADMESYQNTLTQVMHSSTKAAETMKWAISFAAKTPFEIPGIVEATTRLTTYGINAQDTLGTIGDMASVMGKVCPLY